MTVYPEKLEYENQQGEKCREKMALPVIRHIYKKNISKVEVWKSFFSPRKRQGANEAFNLFHFYFHLEIKWKKVQNEKKTKRG